MPSENTSQKTKLPTLALIALGGLFAANAVSIDTPLVAIPGLAQGFDIQTGAAQIVTSVFFLGFGLAQIPLGLISDRYGRRPVLFGGVAVMLICALLAAIAPTFELVVAARFVQGMATATTALIARAVIRDTSSGREAAAAMSFLAGTLAVMIFAMPLLAGVILWAFGWREVMWQVFLYGAIFAALGFIYIPETISDATKREARAQNIGRQVIGGIKAFVKSPTSVAATSYDLFSFCTYFMFLVMGASLIVEHYGRPAFTFSLVFAAVAFMQFVAAGLNRRYVEQIGVSKMMNITAMIMACTVVIGVTLFLMPSVPLGLFIAGSCVLAFAYGLIFPNVNAIALEPHPTRAGIASSIFGTTTSVGTSIVGFIAGTVYNGEAGTMFLMSAISGACALTVFVFMRRHLAGHPASAA